MKVDRGGTHAAEYVQRIDRTPVQMTFNRKLALLMGRFTAEDAVKSIPKLPTHPGVSLRRGGCLAFVLEMVNRTYLQQAVNCEESSHELVLQNGVSPHEPPSKECLVRQRCYAGSCPKTRQPDRHQPLLRRSKVHVAISGDVREHGRRMKRLSHHV